VRRRPTNWATNAILEPSATGFGDFHSTALMFSYHAVMGGLGETFALVEQVDAAG
jgi:hypothetical protein